MSASAPVKTPYKLAVAIVLFHPDPAWLERTVKSLWRALQHAHDHGSLDQVRLFLVDNEAASADSPWHEWLRKIEPDNCSWLDTAVLAGHGNRGFGTANNLAFANAGGADYLLALNPDVELDVHSISAAATYLQQNLKCSLITPVATAPNGEPLYLVRDYPTLRTLAIRGFVPARWRQSLFSRRLNTYERRDIAYNSAAPSPRFAGGAFMFMRKTAFDRAHGFDEHFFLYFEDYDLSYRMSMTGDIVRLSDCRIVHAGGEASAKGWQHRKLFIQSAWRFFGKHGWRW